MTVIVLAHSLVAHFKLDVSCQKYAKKEPNVPHKQETDPPIRSIDIMKEQLDVRYVSANN